ncbi:cell envelope biogenesis protein OmpA [Leptospira meyeri]|uniref:cell envelope biogenesis protein OmpA n=1 Tax=Leptospira meyeri TaxID=29508 RepID=UPI001082C2F2|nr:cell envelope biogenesis protein OmpA [Leptospira meyeri]TGM70391.1 cell envelope biogenesis protein OmpA [Leptospira meyeri]
MMAIVFLVLVGTGFILVWFWEKSPKTKNSVIAVHKEKSLITEKNTNVMESQTMEFSVLFGAGLSDLEKESMDWLREHLTPSILSQIGSITLTGSADASGNLATNRRLVKERIGSVEKYLVSIGISKNKIKKTYLEPSFGKSPELRKLLRSVMIQYKIET